MKLALIAHTNKKAELIDFIKENEPVFAKFSLIATEGTGDAIATNFPFLVKKLKAGTLGGDHEVGALISKNDVDAVFFFRDPVTPLPYEPDVNTIIRLCDVYNVPIATNIKTAKFILKGLEPKGLGTNQKELEISNVELNLILDFVKSQMPAKALSQTDSDEQKEREIDDPLMKKVLIYIFETKKVSASALQRKFRIGYNRAARFIEELEIQGYIGDMDGNRPREVLISEEQYQELIVDFGKADK